MKFALPKKDEAKSHKIDFLLLKVNVVYPTSRLHTRWTYAMMVPLTYEVWAIPFRWAVTSPGERPEASCHPNISSPAY